MNKLLFFVPAILGLAITGSVVQAQTTTYPGPPGSSNFAQNVFVLANGNYVVTDPYWDNGSTLDVGAVYLYNGATHALISRLNGSTTNDAVGNSGITLLPSGNFLVRSSQWTNGSATYAGAVTWCSGTAGVNAAVSASNSLVGTNANSYVGSNTIVVLPNGNYVVPSPNWGSATVAYMGAVTWGSGTTGVSGTISASNSLVGSQTSDYVGNNGIVILSNGNYVVRSGSWANGGVTHAGAATWCSGTAPTTGAVSASNSLVGSSQYDYIANNGITALTNGNYVVASANWKNGSATAAGAVTWCSAAGTTVGPVTTSNSLTGTTANDNVGTNGVLPLSNGHYVVRSQNWQSTANVRVGAVTWGNGTTGISGAVSASNSLVGSNNTDYIGNYGVDTLTNGNYVVRSGNWKNGTAANAGAVTWCSGTSGLTGAVSTSNSFVGAAVNDYFGSTFKALSNGNYVVGSQYVSIGGATYAGAVAWCSGTATTSAVVSASNALVGSTANDYVGNSAVVALSNGNYVVGSSNWSNGAATQAGAATWGSGTTGVTGVISASNSLVGTKTSDLVGSGVTPLTNGNYVVRSSSWGNGAATSAGAVTWANGTTGITGAVTATNSLVGSTTNDRVGNGGITVLTNGNYVARSQNWSNGSATNAGATTWGNGTTGIAGTVSATNSLIGTNTSEQVGNQVIVALPNGDYIVRSSSARNGTVVSAGAITPASGTTGQPFGAINSCNSVLGTVASGGSSIVAAYNAIQNYLLVGKYRESAYAIYRPSGHGYASDNDQSTKSVGSSTVIFGASDCSTIATVTPTGGATAVSGSVTALARVQSSVGLYNGTAFVRRFYDITPASNASTATAGVTLYFTQADFTDYNANNGNDPDLPTGPADAAGIASLRIAQHHGTSATGMPGTFTGWAGAGPAKIAIDPVDADVSWNASESRWEVRFDITGFSGFFAYGAVGSTPLGIDITEVSAKAAGARNRIDWATDDENGGATFGIERQENGTFREIGQLPANGSGSYTYFDEQPIGTLSYYRIRTAIAGEATTWSKTVSVRRSAGGSLSVTPQPATESVNIRCSDANLVGAEATIFNIQGMPVHRFVIRDQNRIEIGSWVPGIYSLRLPDGSVLSISKL